MSEYTKDLESDCNPILSSNQISSNNIQTILHSYNRW